MKVVEKISSKNYKRKINIKLIYIVATFIITSFIILIDVMPRSFAKHIYFLDVGQGDCIIVKDKAYTFMIDGGGDRFMDDNNNIGNNIVFPFLIDQNIKKLDVIFVTHVHYDHIKGVLEILDKIKVDTVVLPSVYEKFCVVEPREAEATDSDGTIKTNIQANSDSISSLFEGGDELFLLDELVKKTKEFDIELLFMSKGDLIQGEESKFICIYPYKDKKYSEHENENSLVLELQLGGITALLTGDIEDQGEQWIVNHVNLDEDIDIIKVPHHGSNSSSTEEFLLKVKPKVAIVSVGENLFGHPSDIVKMRYKNLNIPFYSTKKYGMIDILVKDKYYRILPYKGELIDESITRTFKE